MYVTYLKQVLTNEKRLLASVSFIFSGKRVHERENEIDHILGFTRPVLVFRLAVVLGTCNEPIITAKIQDQACA